MPIFAPTPVALKSGDISPLEIPFIWNSFFIYLKPFVNQINDYFSWLSAFFISKNHANEKKCAVSAAGAIKANPVSCQVRQLIAQETDL